MTKIFNILNFLKTRKKLTIVAFFVTMVLFLYWIWMPNKLFDKPTSTILLDKNGELLAAKIANDGQWRFPPSDSLPEKFVKCLITFEDKRFFYHNGFDMLSFARAVKQMFENVKIVSGGSTITMQVLRMQRENDERTLFNKLTEILLAYRLELSYSKKEILSLYANNAPFGSNVVGIEAASWRYFGKAANELSWSESATLAILPNAPSLIFPGKNQKKLKIKRDFLLKKLYENKLIDSLTYILSVDEELPGKPYPLPQYCPHLLDRAISEGYRGQIVSSSIDIELQKKVIAISQNHYGLLSSNSIQNMAIVVLDVESGNALAYLGNTKSTKNEFSNDVDIVKSRRSTGSILKPYLYALCLKEGTLLPTTLVPDIPTQIAGYTPQNYNQTYDGAVPAKMALARSLNIPAVKMLQQYGLEKFNYKLKKLGLTTLNKPAGHYGLSIILGGAEATLWDICGVYASMARTLNHFPKYNGKYNPKDFHAPGFTVNSKLYDDESNLTNTTILDAASIYSTFEAMVEVSRPDEDQNWRLFNSHKKVAWKTGTSFGFKDAWAVGCTPKYIVGVWVGNASGEGRPNLTGIAAAAPIMLDVIKILPATSWFRPPFDEITRVPICKQSGYRASTICNEIDTLWIPVTGLKTQSCPYHQIVHLDASKQFRVTADCEVSSNIINEPWFILPPVMEWYYKTKNSQYKSLPPFKEGCQPQSNAVNIDLIYPKNNAKIYVPIEIDGNPGKTIFVAAHRNPSIVVYWHLDGAYLGSTTHFHQFALHPKQGKHVITLVDSNGEMISRTFEIVSDNEK